MFESEFKLTREDYNDIIVHGNTVKSNWKKVREWEDFQKIEVIMPYVFNDKHFIKTPIDANVNIKSGLKTICKILADKSSGKSILRENTDPNQERSNADNFKDSHTGISKMYLEVIAIAIKELIAYKNQSNVLPPFNLEDIYLPETHSKNENYDFKEKPIESRWIIEDLHAYGIRYIDQIYTNWEKTHPSIPPDLIELLS